MAALRLPLQGTDHMVFVPAAGLPWFVALFGRDTLIVSLQTMMVYPEFAAGTLEVLGQYQATKRDDYRDAEPGKILHELRYGELAHFKLIPHTPYYGTADATPLYLIALHSAWRATGDRKLIERHLLNAEACLTWIDKYGDRDGDGFQEYQTRSTAGYENMAWKDSGDSVMYPDGELVRGPKALCELQGYVYDAWLRMAEVYDELGNKRRANALRKKAAMLFKRFNEYFWDEKSSFYAYALDGDKKKVLSVASNVGQCLWSGIIAPERAALVVKRLMQKDMWSGWGIRTLSSDHPSFNPYNYQTGAVWPHDNSLIAMGMRRYGFAAEAAEVARDVSGAASHFLLNQLPERALFRHRRFSDGPPSRRNIGRTLWLRGFPAGKELRIHRQFHIVLRQTIRPLSIGNCAIAGTFCDVPRFIHISDDEEERRPMSTERLNSGSAHPPSDTRSGQGSKIAPFGSQGERSETAEAPGKDRGRGATTPFAIPARGWKDILLRVYANVSRHRIMALAAGMTYYSILAIFPAIAALFAVYGLFADPSSIARHLDQLGGFLPGGALDIARDQLTRVASKGSQTLGLTFLVALGVSLWSANAAMKSLFDTLNIVYGEEEKRGFFWLNAISLCFTIVGILFVLAALGSIVAVPVILNYVGLSHAGDLLLRIGRWPGMYLVITFALAVIYRYGASREAPQWRWITWGSAIAALLWLGVSALFSFYASNFGKFNETYGSLGAVIGFMTWLWISAIVILLGAEIDAEMEHQTAHDTTEGAPKPMGTRGARVADTVGAAQGR